MTRTHRSIKSISQKASPFNGEGSLSVEVREMKEDQSILECLETHSQLQWPTSKLPPQTQMGDRFVLQLKAQDHEETSELERMRRLLEELVN